MSGSVGPAIRSSFDSVRTTSTTPLSPHSMRTSRPAARISAGPTGRRSSMTVGSASSLGRSMLGSGAVSAAGDDGR